LSNTPRTDALFEKHAHDHALPTPAEADFYQMARTLERELAEALAWSDDDRPLPEDEAIQAAHPLKTKAYDRHREAMRLVGAKRSKGALVDLVNWLLSRCEQSSGDTSHG
jgi:hypothetical protein